MNGTFFGINLFENNDSVNHESQTAKLMSSEMANCLENETGWDRLKVMLSRDEFGMSPEMDSVVTTAAAGFLCGSFLGAAGSSKTEYVSFVDKNKASQFTSHHHAKHELQQKVTRAMMYGGFRIGWRLALFTGSYKFFTTAVSTYRNKSSVIEYSAGGLLAGAAYKFPMGPKAMFSGGLVGSGLGLIAGCLSVGIMKMTGTTTEELRFWRQDWKASSHREIVPKDDQHRGRGTLELAREFGLTTIDEVRNEVSTTSAPHEETDKQQEENSESTAVEDVKIDLNASSPSEQGETFK